MLTEIYHDFPTLTSARKALTHVRKTYHVALRGSVAIPSYTRGGLRTNRLHVALSGSGFSASELASIFRCME